MPSIPHDLERTKEEDPPKPPSQCQGAKTVLASLFWEDLGGIQASVVTKVAVRSQSIVVNVGILDKVELQIVTDLHPGSSELLYPENEISSVRICHLLVITQ